MLSATNIIYNQQCMISTPASLVRARVRAYAARVVWDGVWGWLAFPGPCMAGGRPSTCHFEQNVCESAFV